MHALLTCFTAAALSLFAAAVPAQQQVSIVTSLPKDLAEVYKRAFEARNPGVKVEVLNRGTSVAIAFVRQAPETVRSAAANVA